MQPDKKMLDRVLALNDDRLRLLIRRLLGQYGLDASAISLEQIDMNRLREIAAKATDEDVDRFFTLVGSSRKEGSK